jgi:diadenosine tetraphosphate (Ap4A) HIT family hydrolase
MINPTIAKFGHPKTLVRDYDHWVVLLRPQQVTAGSLVLAAKSEAMAYGQLPQEAFIEQAVVVAEIESTLSAAVAFERINYLMLMMVDPNVHFHVIPRYSGTRSISGIDIADHGWPGFPDLKSAVVLDEAAIVRGVEAIASLWSPDKTDSG